MTAITLLLSQYELLLLLCDTLSTADIISLGSTCKEHHDYIHGSEITFDNLLSAAHCSGKGSIDHARVFGAWRGDELEAEQHCLRDKDIEPCTSCGVPVCNVKTQWS